MRVLRDVTIDRAEGNEVHAVSQVAAVVGEEMTLDVMGAGAEVALKVRVIESRPLMVQGVVRHQVRLAVTSGRPEEAPAASPEREAEVLDFAGQTASMEAI